MKFPTRTPLGRWLGRIFITTAFTIAVASEGFAQNGVSLAQFDSFIFQQGNAEQTRERLQSSIDLQLRRLEHATELREEQKQRLRLAGEGDIQRFFNRVVAARHEFQALVPENIDFNEAYKIAAPLQMELNRGLFDRNSMFAKVVQTTLDQEQLSVHQKQEKFRIEREREAYVRMYISSVEPNLPITAAQREALVRLATSHLDELHPNSAFQVQLVTYRLFTIPEEKLTPIFDEGQMKAFRKMRGRMEGIGQMLRDQGVLDDAE